jgi:hypothetical protein
MAVLRVALEQKLVLMALTVTAVTAAMVARDIQLFRLDKPVVLEAPVALAEVPQVLVTVALVALVA